MTRLVKIGNEIIDVDQLTRPRHFVSFADGTVSEVTTANGTTFEEQAAQAAKLQADMIDRITFKVPKGVQGEIHHG